MVVRPVRMASRRKGARRAVRCRDRAVAQPASPYALLSDRWCGDPAIPCCADAPGFPKTRNCWSGRLPKRNEETGRLPLPVSRISCRKPASGTPSSPSPRLPRFSTAPATGFPGNPGSCLTGRSGHTKAVRNNCSRLHRTRRWLWSLLQNFDLRMTCTFIINFAFRLCDACHVCLSVQRPYQPAT